MAKEQDGAGKDTGGSDSEGIKYPYAHPRGEQIHNLKKEIDGYHKSASSSLSDARLAYAEKDWKLMGDKIKEVFEFHRKVGLGLVELESIITSPLI
jgi:hypothetical protein